MLLTGLIMIAALESPPTPPPAVRLEQVRSQRSKDSPLSQTSLQPIQLSPCTPARTGCRHIDFFDVHVNDANSRVEVNIDLDYVNSDGQLGLFPGESVAIKLDPASSKPVVQSSRLAPPMDAASNVPAMTAAGPAEKDVIQVTFTQGADGGSRLVVRNGFDQLLDYRALMRMMNGAVQPTDVCQVLPGIFDIEN
ncbi:MAG: hypothetical protein JWM33_1035, partial [Caulobacteraceae bacterium]|nr:hypothetical protein [Caulobacteraceae bacterium]